MKTSDKMFSEFCDTKS